MDVLTQRKRLTESTDPDGGGRRLNGCRVEMDGLVAGVINQAATSQHNLFVPVKWKDGEFPFLDAPTSLINNEGIINSQPPVGPAAQ